MGAHSSVNPIEADWEYYGTKNAGVLRVSVCNLAAGQTRAAGSITRGFDLLFQRENFCLAKSKVARDR